MIDNMNMGRLSLVSLSSLLLGLLSVGCGRSSNSTSTPPEQQAATPTFSPAAGTYTSAQSVAIADATQGVSIYYTTDGSTPTTSSTAYTGPISLSGSATTTIKAIAAAPPAIFASQVASATYVINLAVQQAAAPTFSPAAGTFTSAQNITLNDSVSGATIYYTTDGSTPTTTSHVYSGPIALADPSQTTINAIATASGYTTSVVASAAYTINQPPAATPSISPASGTFTSAQTVTITDTTPGATIYYTVDGGTPTTASSVYSKPLTISFNGTTNVEAIAVATGYAASAVATATYVLNLSSATPSYTYKNVQIVGGGFVDGLFFHPKAQGLMYARTDVGGAYRWNNTAGGDTEWVALQDFVGRFDSGFNLGVDSLGLDPNDPTRVYLAVGEYADSFGTNGYVLSSGDMGKSFTAVALPFKNGSNDNGRFAGERLSVDPSNGKHIYLGTRQNGLYQSKDQGATFAQVAGFPVTAGTGTSYDPGGGIVFEQFLATSGTANGNTKTVYYGVSDPTTGLYVSNDGGTTFAAVPGQPTGFYVNASAFDPQSRYLYLSYARQAKVTGYQQSTPCTSGCTSIGPGGVNDGQIWRYTLPTSSAPNGVWTNITPPLLAGETSAQYANNPYGFSGVTIDPSHPDTVMVTTLNKYYPPPYDDVFRSLDDGATWVNYGSNISRDGSLSPWINFGQAKPDGGNWLNHPVVDPFNSDHVMYGDGQTIWQTTNATAVDGAATSTTAVNPGNATNWSIGALGVEETVVLGLASPPSGPANLLSVMGDLGGFTHTSLTASSPAQQNPQLTNGTSVDFAWQKPLDVARVGDNTSAQGSGTAVQLEAFSSDGGLTWTPSASLPSGVTKGDGTIAVAADGSTLVWMPSDPGVMANYSSDHGATWHASTGGPAQGNNESTFSNNGVVVRADRVNASKFYLFNIQTAALYVSADGGQTFTQQPAVSGVSATGFVVSPAAEGDLWITSYNGVLHSTNSGASFSAVLGPGNVGYALGFGAAATGQAYPAIYLIGQLATDTNCISPNNVSLGFTTATNCIYRSTDGGQTFLRINDYAHQYSSPSYITGDPRVFGRYYLGTPGRGIIEADSPN